MESKESVILVDSCGNCLSKFGFLYRGIEAVVIDYVRPIIFGNVISKLAVGAVYVLSITTLAGLFFFITNDVGIVVAIKQLWQL
ncbi:hypothetical protein Cfor_04993 [Coptotermes formosanus]|jgi:succinate dehydrogenase (ubiquinone) membrane anchor subunit|uniref:Succinate dehydrogenase [ubiquinone] cytochrome b small subunit n=1 Tax=Coptotermes formosanus TaxID=36987 RepID=A0A6L2PA10_COPFO|nr:hypothetical protein Cfor_04993 [Coptotermes formosanus]